MTVDSKKILKRLTAEKGGRKAHSLWLETALLKEFEKTCTSLGQKHSRVLEELMRDFVEDVKQIKKT